MQTSLTRKKLLRYYVRDSIVPFEEDESHEFKGHRNLCVEELPHWTHDTKTRKASRRAVSRSLNAFLNTGKGGTVYLGIIDNGCVRGLKLTVHQMQHITDNLSDLFTRYRPPVQSHRYKIKFVQVLEAGCSDEDIVRQCQGTLPPSPLREPAREHFLRTSSFCWCDKDAVAQYNCGVISPDYVIEITIKAWDSEDPRNRTISDKSNLNLHPVHEDEMGVVYFRRQASLVSYSMNEIAVMTRLEVQAAYTQKYDLLQKQLELLSI